jgi:hypothetical protein
MKYCSSVVMGDIAAYYLDHTGDEVNKAFDVVGLVW